MIRAALALLALACLAVPAQAASPIRDDRYFVAWGGMGADVVKREIRRAMPSRSLAGVVAPLAAKARQIEATCGSRVISAVRHTYIAGTGGRLSLHASGRAVDIAGNPACIYRELRNWPGGVSIDYSRVRHVHFSYAPGGPEWGTRFHHYRGSRRHRHRRRS